ncbi:ABC transporter permease [Roseofilum casamattae]|uniref:Iron export ABC transporter permease subunit FetB n=1 Tax=Roseofilum casamattae BLCC-M143 TaxID=3022442 RepID=A0ABT7BYB2_9CYAN|nr:iron export ABC transporter permease subunit FetB [Roseofilum casamattae]MDJ1183263.1 iron export ABC transporter permease subunit FetB [Roseofilum casamattae BLCC-M143]
MSASTIPISPLQLGTSALLILINISLSFALRLGLEKSLIIATARMLVQLLLIGYVLNWLFTLSNPLVIIALALFMASIAGISGVNRTSRRFVGIYWQSLLSILVAAFLITQFSIIGVIRVDPWYDPQYFIPLLGMILGNALNGVSLGLDQFMDNLVANQGQIETLLSLGATRWEATHKEVQSAVRRGMIPMINSMMVTGLVSLPGMMTGQILAGANPLDAVRYQTIVMFAIASGTALATLGVVLLAWNSLLSPAHQLRLDKLRRS